MHTPLQPGSLLAVPLQRRLAGPNCARLRQWPAANVPGPPLPKHQRRLQPAARSIAGTSSRGTRLVGTGAQHQQAPRLRNSPPPSGQASGTKSVLQADGLQRYHPARAFPGLSGPVCRLTLELRLRLVELRPPLVERRSPIGRAPAMVKLRPRLFKLRFRLVGLRPAPLAGLRPPICQTPLPIGRTPPLIG